MSVIVVEAIRGRCASFMILTATVSEIFGGQTNSYMLVVGPNRYVACTMSIIVAGKTTCFNVGSFNKSFIIV